MLYVFVRDMWDVLRLRYRSPETYLYSPLVMAAVLLLLGVVNAASMSPLFGSGAAAVCLSVILVMVKWLVLSRSMRKVLHYYGAPRLPLWGFILVSEALLLPLLLVLYVPALAAFALLWQAWVFVVQVRGLMWMGNATVGRVFGGLSGVWYRRAVRGYGDSDAVYCRRLVGYGNVESKPAGVDVCP